MPKVTLIEHSGESHTIEAETGQSLMQAATGNNVPGILAICGGNCSCATCHVYVDPAWLEKLPPPALEERDLLDCVSEVRENSRLSCQIRMHEALDGLVVQLPESQE